MINELQKLRELTEALTGNGYLKDQAEEWEYALNAIPEGIYIIDTKFRLKFINKALAKRLNINSIDACNEICYELIYGLTMEEISKTLSDKWAESVEPIKIDYQYIDRLNGWFNVSRSPIHTKTGKLLGFICILQDITAEQEARLELEEREQTLKSLFDSAPIGMGLIDRDTGKFVSVNKCLTDLSGFSEKELIGNSFELLFVNVDNFSEVPIGDDTPTIETQIVSKMGEIVDIYLRSSNVGDKSLLVFTVLDVTEKKKKDKLIELNEERLEATLTLTRMANKTKEEIVKFALEEGVRLTNSDVGYIHFVNTDNEEISLSLFMWSDSVHTKCKTEATSKYPLNIAGCWADCVRTKVPTIHNDYKNYKDKKELPAGHIDIINHMSVPVLNEDGNVVVVAGVGNKNSDYDKSDIRQLSIFMNSMWDIIKNK